VFSLMMSKEMMYVQEAPRNIKNWWRYALSWSMGEEASHSACSSVFDARALKKIAVLVRRALPRESTS
jgi:hypothetical protein